MITDHRGKPVRNADVCLFAEDEGTLQVIGYRTPQPSRYFYADRPLSVGTWTTLEQILDEDWGSRSTDNKGMFIGEMCIRDRFLGNLGIVHCLVT